MSAQVQNTKNIFELSELCRDTDISKQDLIVIYRQIIALAREKSLPKLKMVSFMHELARHAVLHMEGFNAKDIKGLLSAHASCKMPPADTNLKRALQQQITSKVEAMSIQDIADLMWAYAKNNMGDQHVLRQVVEKRAVECMSDGEAKHVANILWASARLGWVPSEKLWKCLEAQGAAVAKVFNPQDVSNTLWAYATLGRQPADKLLRGLEERAAVVVEGFKPQEVSNTLWAYATLGKQPADKLLRGLEE